MCDGAIAQYYQECARKLIFVVSGNTFPRLKKIQSILHQWWPVQQRFSTLYDFIAPTIALLLFVCDGPFWHE
jgi:hypothetical protein